jgi:hypothetical protein
MQSRNSTRLGEEISMEVAYKWRSLGYLAPLFGFHLELHNVDQFLVDMVKAQLRYWSLTLLGCTLIVNQ